MAGRPLAPGWKADAEARPNPVPWVQLDQFDERHRRLRCIWYDQCLTKAAKSRWRGWSCFICNVRKEVRGDEKGAIQETLH